MNDGLRPYPEYKDSGLHWLGRIPKHWNEKRAKYFFREVDERSTTGAETLMSVSHKTGVTPRKKNVTMFKAASNVGHKICRTGDLAINTLWAWMAALGVSRDTGLVSPAYGVYRQRDALNYHPDFIDLLLRTQPYAAEYRCRSTGITTSRLRLYPIDFLCIPLVQPPPSEQGLIVTFLRKHELLVRKFIRNRRRMIEVLNEQQRAIISQAVTRGLDPTGALKPSGASWLGDIPERWKCMPIKRVATINPSRSEAFHLRDSVEPVVFLPMERVSTQGDIDASQRRPISEVWQGFTYFRRGDVVVAKITPCFENGKGACLTKLPTEIGFGTTEFIVLRAKSLISPEFLYRLTCLGQFRDLGVESMTGAAGQQRVSQEFVANFPVPIPPPDEQEEILGFIERETSRFRTAIARAEREIELIREYRTRLITDIVTGKLDVRHLVSQLDAGDADELAAIDVEEDFDGELPDDDEAELAEEATDGD